MKSEARSKERILRILVVPVGFIQASVTIGSQCAVMARSHTMHCVRPVAEPPPTWMMVGW